LLTKLTSAERRADTHLPTGSRARPPDLNGERLYGIRNTKNAPPT